MHIKFWMKLSYFLRNISMSAVKDCLGHVCVESEPRENLHAALGLALCCPCPTSPGSQPGATGRRRGDYRATEGRTHRESPLPLQAGIPGLTALQTEEEGIEQSSPESTSCVFTAELSSSVTFCHTGAVSAQSSLVVPSWVCMR